MPPPPSPTPRGYLTAQLDNQGTLTTSGPLVLNAASAQHTNEGTINVSGGDLTVSQSGTNPSFTNTGTITIGSGRTLSISGGAFTPDSGTLSGSVSLSSVTLGSGTLSNTATVTMVGGGESSDATLINQGTITVLAGATTLNGSFSNEVGATLTVQGNSDDYWSGNAVLTLAQGFTNAGAIALTDVGTNDYYPYQTASLVVTAGTLVNAAGGTISASTPFANAPRYLTAQLDNQGTLTTSGPLVLNAASAQHTNEGTINVSGGDLTVSQSGTNPSFTNTGAITIASGQTLAINGGTFSQSAGTLSGAGTLSINSATLNLGTDFSNAVTALNLYASTVNGPGTLTNAETLNLSGDTINAALDNQGSILATQVNSLNGSFSNEVGATLTVQGNSDDYWSGNAVLTLAQGFTNAGAIALTDVGTNDYYPYQTASLVVTSGTLVNAAGGTISASTPFANAPRYLTAQLDNQGTLTTSGPLVLNAASAQHTNEGTINVSGGDLTVSQSGTNPSFTNTGTITIGSGRTLSISGGAFTPDSGTLSGSVSLSSVTLGSGTLSNTATVTMVGGGESSDATLINQGTITVLAGATTLNGSFSNEVGATLTVQGNSDDYWSGNAVLTLAQGFTNAGAIALTDVGTNDYYVGTQVAH